MQSERSPRRVRVERCIYKRPDAPRGREYEVAFTDSTGRQRWRMVSGGLKEARLTRAEVVSRMGRGERVAPTRAKLRDVAEAWLDAQAQLAPRTRERYEINLRLHVIPRLGRLKISEVTPDDVAGLIAEMQSRGYAAWTIRGVLTVLSRVLGHAARRGLIPDNPVRRLERGERPKTRRRELRVLEREEIRRVLDKADARYRPLLALSLFTGLRQSEALGLRWSDVDFQNGLVHVRGQLDRRGTFTLFLKSDSAFREVVLMPALEGVLKKLREEAFARGWAKADDPVFASARGTPMNHRNIVRRGLEPALAHAGLPHIRWHDLRHTYASILISGGANVVFLSKQLGHSSTKETLDTYAHLFDRAEHGEKARSALENSFGAMLASVGPAGAALLPAPLQMP